ncbi:MAG: iron-sulfur cluster assembly scaffold protein [Bryobacteraceae bacterium]
MYHPLLLDHFQNPRNAGDLGERAVAVDVSNPACGDMMRLSARAVDGRVQEVRFLTRGCTASIACGSALTELVLGRTPAELKTIRAADVEAAVGELIPESKHAAVLCVDAARALARALEV